MRWEGIHETPEPTVVASLVAFRTGPLRAEILGRYLKVIFRRYDLEAVEPKKNWCRKVSRVVADSAHTVVVEDVNTKGTKAQSGKHVKAKAGLNREIQNAGWSQLRAMLDYKAGKLVTVNPKYASQTCHVYGHVDARSRRMQAEFKCVRCGRESHADSNAALNIWASGSGATGRGRAATLVGPTIGQIDTLTTTCAV